MPNPHLSPTPSAGNSPSPPFGGLDIGLYGYANPALLSYVEGVEQGVAWSDSNSTQSWGLFTAAPHLGFGMVNGRRDREYRAGLSTGDRNFSLGVSMGWGSVRHAVLGGIWRPGPRLSVGGTFTSTFEDVGREGAVDLALRPWGNERLTLYADYARSDETEYWSTGAIVGLGQGLALTGRFFSDRALSVGLSLGLGAADFQAQARGRTFQTYAARFGAQRGNLFRPRARYLSLELSGPVQHRRFAFFDDSQSLLSLIALLDRAHRDPAIKGLVINASGLRISPALGWELREKLRQISAGGKRVVVYIDRVDLSGYHWVSAADHLVLDPAGMVGLQGYVAGYTYFKDALDKLGIGFDEWRLFRYKSAAEVYVRRDMSEEEREQLTALLDDWYALARSDISTDRELAPEQFDRLVEETAFFLPQEALDAGLVDRLGRWSEIDRTVEDVAIVAANSYTRPADRRWGQRKRIAIVYALGICAMDTGIGGAAARRRDCLGLRGRGRCGAARGFSGRRHPALGSRGRRRAAMPRAKARHRLAGLRRGFGRVHDLAARRCHCHRAQYHHRLDWGYCRLGVQHRTQGKVRLEHEPCTGGSPRGFAFWHDPALAWPALARPHLH